MLTLPPFLGLEFSVLPLEWTPLTLSSPALYLCLVRSLLFPTLVGLPFTLLRFSFQLVCCSFFCCHACDPLVVVDNKVFRESLQTPDILQHRSHLNAQYLRITLNWVTTSFFLFSFVHCFAQGTLQSFLFSADDDWGSFTTAIVDHAQINSTAFVQYTGRHGQYSLELCSQVPVMGGEPNPCDHFYTAGQTEPVSIPRRFLPTDSPVSEPSDSSVRL